MGNQTSIAALTKLSSEQNNNILAMVEQNKLETIKKCQLFQKAKTYWKNFVNCQPCQPRCHRYRGSLK